MVSVLDTEIIAETINDILFEGTKDEIQALMDDQSLMIAWSFYRGERRGSYELRINDLWTRGLFDKDDLPIYKSQLVNDLEMLDVLSNQRQIIYKTECSDEFVSVTNVKAFMPQLCVNPKRSHISAIISPTPY